MSRLIFPCFLLTGFIICTSLISCDGGANPASEEVERIPQFDLRREQIQQMETEGYSIAGIQDEGGVIRVDVTLDLLPTGGELERKTLNILHEIQAVIGTDERLAVWAHDSQNGQAQGMAFYSPLTETYHYKAADELN